MKLHAYLSLSRHGIYYFRWPLPDTTRKLCTRPNTKRRTLRVSLRTRCPKEAGTLARHLAVCGDTITKHIEQSGMNYGELRAKVHGHFKRLLKKAKARRDELGPYTELEKERIADTIRLHKAANEDYWDMLGREYARSELDKYTTAPGSGNRRHKKTPF